ncbi:uncharacterized protein TNCV_571661 [Trichonephila clavipes]|nr:uncharacterized protein TNCV_571661 [Trichonephila clavipes]
MQKGHPEMQKGLEDMQKSQGETRKGQQEIQKGPEKLPVPASPVSVKQSTYDGKIYGELYKTQFSIISEANGWTEGVKACQLAASLREEAAKVLQTLLDTERLNMNSLYNALDLRFSQKYSKDYARLQMKTRLQKTGEMSGLKEEEIQKAVRMADVQDLKSALLYALKLEASNEASSRDHHFIREVIGTADTPCESPSMKEIN